jgi:hypothetical protein
MRVGFCMGAREAYYDSARMDGAAAGRSAGLRGFPRGAGRSPPIAIVVALGIAAAAATAVRAAPAGALVPVSARDLCVTEGQITPLPTGALSVDSPKMRAYLNRGTRQVIEARFTYLGATAHDAPLGSGQMRRQFGLKFEAGDPCNLLYVMWRIEPDAKLVVSVKRNDGAHTSAECGNRGYENVKPQRAVAIPRLNSGDTHTLRAEFDGRVMQVSIDDAPVWEGSVGAAASGFDGPVGLRSDNARLSVTLRAGPPLAGAKGQPRACAAAGNSD